VKTRVRKLTCPSPVRDFKKLFSTIEIKLTVQIKMRICTLVNIWSYNISFFIHLHSTNTVPATTTNGESYFFLLKQYQFTRFDLAICIVKHTDSTWTLISIPNISRIIKWVDRNCVPKKLGFHSKSVIHQNKIRKQHINAGF
jgi:hypothetical protein